MWKFGVLGKDFSTIATASSPTAPCCDHRPDGNKMDRFGRADEVINVIDLRQSYLQDVLRFSLYKLGFEREAEHSIHFGYEVVALSANTAKELGVEVGMRKRMSTPCRAARASGLRPRTWWSG